MEQCRFCTHDSRRGKGEIATHRRHVGSSASTALACSDMICIQCLLSCAVCSLLWFLCGMRTATDGPFMTVVLTGLLAGEVVPDLGPLCVVAACIAATGTLGLGWGRARRSSGPARTAPPAAAQAAAVSARSPVGEGFAEPRLVAGCSEEPPATRDEDRGTVALPQELVLTVLPESLPGARHYAVWEIPGALQMVGVHTGPHPRTWKAIEAMLPGRSYRSGKGVHLQRCQTLPEALEVYRREAPRHGAPPAPQLHLW